MTLVLQTSKHKTLSVAVCASVGVCVCVCLIAASSAFIYEGSARGPLNMFRV